MNGVDLVRFGMIHSGANQGLLGFHVHLDGQAMTSEDIVSLVVGTIGRHGETKYKNVLLTGKYGPDEQMFHITYSLATRGYHLGAVVSGDACCQWYKNCHWLIVERDITPWSGFYCNEFHYILKDDGDGDPTVPEGNCLLYLCPAKTIKPERVMTFMENSVYTWKLMLKPEKYYERIIWRKTQ